MRVWAWVLVCLALGGCAKPEPIKVGVLHSLTGDMAISERSVAEATLMAVKELNARGGVLGRPVEAVLGDGRSDLEAFAEAAEQLIARDETAALFGCWTSASRKTVLPILKRHDHLLFYPVQYEGLEQSPYVVYTGAAPNQQLIPAVKWSVDNLGTSFFVVGSDYVFPRTAGAIMRDQLMSLQVDLVGEVYLPLGSTDVEPVVEQILAARPQVILNTLNGGTNVAFFKELRRRGVTPERIPVMSFSIAEDELRTMGAEHLAGDYAAWNYFQSLDTPENRSFVSRFKARYGAERVTDDPMEAAYFGVFLWAQAVEDAGSFEPRLVRQTIGDQSLLAPGGVVSVDASTHHTWKTVRIGKIRKDGQFDIAWTSDRPVRPVPYPVYRSRSEWDQFLQDMYHGWGNRWNNPQS